MGYKTGFETTKMKLSWGWVWRRFWDFRQGHSTYLALALSFVNFVVINYHLLISNVQFLANIFPRLWTFALIFLVTYPTLAIIVGYFVFRKRQYPTDITIGTLENPYLWKALPGKEKSLTLPMMRLNLMLMMKLYEKFELLSPTEKRQMRAFLETIDRLMKGETISE